MWQSISLQEFAGYENKCNSKKLKKRAGLAREPHTQLETSLAEVLPVTKVTCNYSYPTETSLADVLPVTIVTSNYSYPTQTSVAEVLPEGQKKPAAQLPVGDIRPPEYEHLLFIAC